VLSHYLHIKYKRNHFSFNTLILAQSKMSSSDNSYGFGTLAIHAGKNVEKWGQMVPPITLTTTHKQLRPGEPIDYTYIQDGNPTRDALQDNLAALEGAKFCRAFSSGMAVVEAIANYFKSGDHVILNSDGYGGTLKFFNRVASDHHGLSVSVVSFNC
jgi:cystathionine beta-lyase/cystathionine gamma-synthase